MDSSFLDQINNLKDITVTNLHNKNILYIKETAKSPLVYLNSENGKVIFKGCGRPEGSDEFFIPIFDFINSNFKKNKIY